MKTSPEYQSAIPEHPRPNKKPSHSSQSSHHSHRSSSKHSNHSHRSRHSHKSNSRPIHHRAHPQMQPAKKQPSELNPALDVNQPQQQYAIRLQPGAHSKHKSRSSKSAKSHSHGSNRRRSDSETSMLRKLTSIELQANGVPYYQRQPTNDTVQSKRMNPSPLELKMVNTFSNSSRHSRHSHSRSSSVADFMNNPNYRQPMFNKQRSN